MYKKGIVWLILSLFYAYQYIIRVIPAVALNDLTEKFSIDPSQFGLFCGIYYFGYTGASIPLSILIDRFNARLVILATIAMSFLGVVPLLTDSWLLVVSGRFISGIGSAGAILALFKVISFYFKPEERTKMLGISVTIGLLGAIYGGKPVADMMKVIGLSGVATTLIAIGCFMAVSTFLLLPKDLNSNKKVVTFREIISDIKSVCTNKGLMLLALAGGLMVGPLEGFADGWSIVTLKVIHGWTDSDASLAPSMMFLGMCVGASVVGYITEKTQKYYTIIALSAAIMAGCMALVVFPIFNNYFAVLGILSVIGIASAYQIVIMSKAGSMVDERLVTTGTAIANMIVMVFGSVHHAIIAKLIPSRDFTPEILQVGLSPVILGLLAALPILLFVARSDKKLG